MASKVFFFIMGSAIFGYALLLLKNPSMLYRINWFDRQTFGWLKGSALLRPIALLASVVAIGLALIAYYYALFVF